MTTKPFFLFDGDGVYSGVYEAQESPLEPGAYISPELSTTVAPPLLQDNQSAKWSGVDWLVITNSEPEPVQPYVPTALDQIRTLETQQLMPRATREFMLLSMESMFTAEQLALNPGYVAVKAFDVQIAGLRAQL